MDFIWKPEKECQLNELKKKKRFFRLEKINLNYDEN